MQLAVRIQGFAMIEPGEVSEVSQVMQAKKNTRGREKRFGKCPGVRDRKRYKEEIRHQYKLLN